ncbi:MAG: pentapeptide repeat-containing protein [Bacteroidales bacterium]|nr:pentapeptide repeat-containing protein [Bacteroidales bacterium]MDD4821568.1 pentapeptide repeat-containing protein [Bacteroidales bacterium]
MSLKKVNGAVKEERVFEKIVFSETTLETEYNNCLFSNCDFSDIHLGEVLFDKCTFVQCNLSLVKMDKTSWSNVRFEECKMTGIEFTNCNRFTFSACFIGSNLNYALFLTNNLQDTRFVNCSLEEATFSESNLKGASFANCNLSRAIFSSSNLEKADFSTALNFEIDPNNNKLTNAKFSRYGLSGLVSSFGIELVD